MNDVEVARRFNARFGNPYSTILVGGASEPSYEPVRAGFGGAVIRYREDFAASALHEVAHWCIAGPARRRQPDYGYWYLPPPRDSAAQAAFYRVELRVQALESLFAAVAGVPFSVSADDLEVHDVDTFRAAVARQARAFEASGTVPARAVQFLADLAAGR